MFGGYGQPRGNGRWLEVHLHVLVLAGCMGRGHFCGAENLSSDLCA